MMFSPFVLVAILATGIVCFLVGQAWCARERDALKRQIVSSNRQREALFGLISRERREREVEEFSEVRERVSA